MMDGREKGRETREGLGEQQVMHGREREREGGKREGKECHSG